MIPPQLPISRFLFLYYSAHIQIGLLHFPHWYEVAEPVTPINSQDKRASPAVDECTYLCSCDKQEDESNERFRPRIVCFFLYLPISFYSIIGNPSTIWAPKRQQSIVLQSAKRASIFKGFHSLKLFNSQNSNTIFY